MYTKINSQITHQNNPILNTHNPQIQTVQTAPNTNPASIPIATEQTIHNSNHNLQMLNRGIDNEICNNQGFFSQSEPSSDTITNANQTNYNNNNPSIRKSDSQQSLQSFVQSPNSAQSQQSTIGMHVYFVTYVALCV